MWKKLIFLFLVIGLLVILIGCGGGNPVVPPGDETTTDEEFTAILDNGENAIDKFEEYCNSIGEEQAYQATVDFLEQQDGVKEAGIGKDGTTIWFECENGYLVGILSTEEEEKGNEKGIEIPFDQSKVTPSAEKALILNPGFNIIGTLKAQRIKGKLNSLYGDYDYESGSDVSIELMKELYQYSVVYMITHGGFIKGYLSFCLDIEATTDIKNQYDGYLKDHYLTISYVENPITKKRKPYISITPLFIKDKNSGTFPDSLICIDACHSLEDTTMAKVFLDKGAYAYCGYTTTMEFGYDTPVDFFENLISEKMNVEDAIDSLSNAHNFDYYPKNPENHGDLYLVEESDEDKITLWLNQHAQAWLDSNIDQIVSLIDFPFMIKNYNCDSEKANTEEEYRSYLEERYEVLLSIETFYYQNNDIHIENQNTAIVYSDKHVKYTGQSGYTFDEINKIYFHLIKTETGWKADEYRVLCTVPMTKIAAELIEENGNYEIELYWRGYNYQDYEGNWQGADVNKYRIYRSVNESDFTLITGANYEPVPGGNGNEFHFFDDTIVLGNDYAYYVTADGGDLKGESEPSLIASVRGI